MAIRDSVIVRAASDESDAIASTVALIGGPFETRFHLGDAVVRCQEVVG